MFLISKIFNFVTDPAALIPVLLGIGTLLLWTRWRRAGRGMVAATVAFILIVSVFPLGEYLLSILENRFPIARSLPPQVTGIITLGGAIDRFITTQRGQAALSERAERMTELVALARRYPKARLVFTGGNAALLRPHVTEAEAARLFFRTMGLDAGRMVFEDRSRNTFENAVFTYDLLAPKAGERWLLITSAMHMPRSVGAFRKAGWKPLPVPVDFNTEWPYRFRPGLRYTSGIANFSLALHEWIGLLAYRILGRSDALFPAPDQAASDAAEQNFNRGQ